MSREVLAGRQLLERALLELRGAGGIEAATRAALLTSFQTETRAPAEAEPDRGTRPYTRRTLLATAAGEVMLATWAPRLRCAPHDHGGSSGNVLIIAGRFHERSYELEGRTLRECARATRNAGSVIAVSRTTIHDMECLDETGTTLHLYAPAPQPMRLYDVDRRETVMVGEGHGAWLPAEHVLSRTPWVG